MQNQLQQHWEFFVIFSLDLLPLAYKSTFKYQYDESPPSFFINQRLTSYTTDLFVCWQTMTTCQVIPITKSFIIGQIRIPGKLKGAKLNAIDLDCMYRYCYQERSNSFIFRFDIWFWEDESKQCPPNIVYSTIYK